MWQYVGSPRPDVDGGLWFRVRAEYKYADVVEVVPVDGVVLVQKGVVALPSDRDSLKAEVQEALWVVFVRPVSALRGLGKEEVLLLLAEALTEYGHVSYDWTTVLAASSDYLDDGWADYYDRDESAKWQQHYHGDLRAYIEAEWLR